MRVLTVGVGCDVIADGAAVDRAAGAEFDCDLAPVFEGDDAGVDARRADGRIGGVDVAAPGGCRAAVFGTSLFQTDAAQ